MARFNFQGKLLEEGRRVISGVVNSINITPLGSTDNPSGSLNIVTDENDVARLSMNLSLPKGDKGDRGDTPTLTVGPITQLPTGSRPTVTSTETSSGYRFDFSFPPGPQGRTGEIGATGATGPAGYTPKIEVVQAIDLLEPGSNAWVEDLNTDISDARWKFHLPKGDKGDPGPTGEAGDIAVITTTGNYTAVTSIGKGINPSTSQQDPHYLSIEKNGVPASDIISGELGVARGGTGTNQFGLNVIVTANGSSPMSGISTASGALYATQANGIASFGTLPVAQGGTGVTTNPSMLTNLASTTAANILAASPRPGVTGTLPVTNGGTGLDSISLNSVLVGNGTSTVKNIYSDSGALYSTGAGIEPSFGTLPIAQGGTGATTVAGAIENLGIDDVVDEIIVIDDTEPVSSHAKIWIKV